MTREAQIKAFLHQSHCRYCGVSGSKCKYDIRSSTKELKKLISQAERRGREEVIKKIKAHEEFRSDKPLDKILMELLTKLKEK